MAGTAWALDVTDSAAIRRVVTEAFAHFGRIDVIVNNAGYGLMGAAEEADPLKAAADRIAGAIAKAMQGR